MIQAELSLRFPRLPQMANDDFISFNDSAPWWHSFTRDQDRDVKERASAFAKEVLQILPSLTTQNGQSGGVVIIVAHQTFLDCLLRLLLDGTHDGWRYGGAKYKLGKAGVIKVGASSASHENFVLHLKDVR